MRHILLDNTITTETGNTIRATLGTDGLMTIAKDNADGELYKSVSPFIRKHQKTMGEQEIHFLVGFETLAKNLMIIQHNQNKNIEKLLNFN